MADDDTKPSMPDQPKTIALPAMTDRALLEDLAREMRGARADIALVSNDLGVVKDRLVIVETWKSSLDARAERQSGRAKQLSDSDLQQDAQLASVIIWRKGIDDWKATVPTKTDLAETTAAQTAALLARFNEVTKNPLVQKAIYAIGGAIVTYAASKGIHLL